jgi:hypothetical protein
MPQLDWITQNPDFNTSGNEQLNYYGNNERTICCDADGNVYCAYFTDGSISGGSNNGDCDIVVFKLNTQGNLLWCKQNSVFNTAYNDITPSICCDNTGIYITYSTYGTVSGGTVPDVYWSECNIVVFKLDMNGEFIWCKENSEFNALNDIGISTYNLCPLICCDNLNHIYIAYSTDAPVSGGTNIGINDIVVFKLNCDDGNLMWIKQNATFNTIADDEFATICCDVSGIYIAYQTYGFASGGSNTGNSDIAIFKLNTDGDIEWIKQENNFNTTDNDCYPAICCDSDANGYIYISYYTIGTVSGNELLNGQNIVVIQMDKNGTMNWCKQSLAQNSLPTTAICCDNTGVYIMYINEQNAPDIILTKAALGGTIIIFKYTKNGDLDWFFDDSLISSFGNNYPSICCNNDGLYAMYQTTGFIQDSSNLGSNDIVVFRLKYHHQPIQAQGKSWWEGRIWERGISRWDHKEPLQIIG